jgi:prefoldin subunit 5
VRFGGYAASHRKPDPETERQALENQAEALQAELDFIKKRMGEIETRATTE